MTKSKNELQIYDKNRSAEIKKSAWMSLSEESQKAYQSDYELFFSVIHKEPKDVQASDILNFIEYLEGKEYKNSSINRKTASLSKMFKIMVMAGEIRVNPVDALKQVKRISRKTSKEIKLSLTIDEIKKAVKTDKKSSTDYHRLSMVIRMLAKTGLRISELTHIKNTDIEKYDEKNKLIHIIGKGKKERSIFIENDFLDEIKTYFPDKKDMPYLFCTVNDTIYNRRVLYKQIRNRFFKVTGRLTHPHELHHWFATFKINTEKQDITAVSKFLGHADVSTTLNSYVRTSLDVKNAKVKI